MAKKSILVKLRSDFTKFFDNICRYCCTDSLVAELMGLRGCNSQEMFDTLKSVGVFKLDYVSDLMLVDNKLDPKDLKLWGLLNTHGDFILKGRYVVAIRDIDSSVIALVGWYPDKRKYITTPTYGFSRDNSFFNFDCYKVAMRDWGGVVYLVEGIFDTLAIRSLGLPALGNMGLELSPIKSSILQRFNKVICIPDSDRAGKSLNPYTNRISGKGKKFVWGIKNDKVFVQLPKGVKDCDDFIREFDCYDDLVGCQKAFGIKKLREER